MVGIAGPGVGVAGRIVRARHERCNEDLVTEEER
jgi:hypothetical protein